MIAEEDFWRLLADYERLTVDESAALGAGDFDELAAIQNLKDPVLETMRALAKSAALDRTNPQLAGRVDQVLVNAARNKKLIDTMLTRAHAERQNLDAARQRLRGLGTAYRPDPRERAVFSARV